jgi:hypothetical protein
MEVTREKLRNDYLQMEESKKMAIFTNMEDSIRQGVICANKLGETRFISKYYTYKTEYMLEFIDRLNLIFVDSTISSTKLPDAQFTAIIIDWTISKSSS